ncbi:LysR family transcriptional regulator [Cupriavidus plantarum]|uniref:LysR family transcriptional regulator n=3 Tax=Cupriavidus plantarum TaxID=942865 RepID=UPI000E26BA76|nr:LysR family transcriptional regulator [Cupriavidus plantarum]NYI01690.1 DNA-binding transcriptional LysR family regulator [Cupriavidus plantarum]REE91003.1 DNA-binding transcriptional LysR family regulator [Cupriavidus plantarum]RLK33676.1 DNA-binding transcriptional LysR family regulator [Cupriavidus plantarum]CAG2148209.1 HTH-type transcriptional regulator HdfR [Cupriavidus plantarum]SMR85394.1 DNA-binding transcriptional regulator, LysR family [Cupriavidus plantarum]
METNYLRAFALVVETGTLAEAARRLNVTPAAVSQQIQVLERQLGTTLLGRAGRTVAPTASGRRLAERCVGLLGQVDELRAWVNQAEELKELRIGTINTALHSLLPDALARFTHAHPDVSVHIRSATSAELFDAVKQLELDAAVCLHPPFALPKTFAWELLRQEPLVVLARARDRQADPHELLRTRPLIRYDRSLGGGRQADDYLRTNGIVPAAERFELSSLLAIAMMVDRGLGVSLVPDIASPLTARLQVAKLDLPVPSEPRRFGVLWRRTSPCASLIQSFFEHARAACGAPIVASMTTY